MNLLRNALIVFLGLLATSALFAQTDNNCFLRDFELKTATIPPYKMMEKTTSAPTVTVTISARDTLGKVSRYIFGNALPSWLGNSVMDATFIGHLRKLAPTLIRYPGGSWGDIFSGAEIRVICQIPSLMAPTTARPLRFSAIRRQQLAYDA